MENVSTLLLDDHQISQRINRIAWQILEDNSAEKEVIIAGIIRSGYQVAEKINAALKSIAPFTTKLIEVHVDKHVQAKDIRITASKEELQGKVIILVDDVLNSGKTMIYALKPFLDADIKKIRTAVLIDRNHRRYPIAADYVGMSLSTTLREHVTVQTDGKSTSAFLS
jgi:pyrimidine operon attenuation protein/uracil phosphoribosyltransferase